MSVTWNSDYNNWPDWSDAGKRVELLFGGESLLGELYVEDWFPDGEGDEIPIWYVEDDLGIPYSFCAADRWRFV